MMRAFPVKMNFAVDRMSLELLPALTFNGIWLYRLFLDRHLAQQFASCLDS